MNTRHRRHRYNAVQDAVEYCTKGIDKDGFQVKFISDYIGSGVFATRKFEAGSFLLEYAGEHISPGEGEQREDEYSPECGSFLFFYGKQKCIDATFSSSLGRMVNDSPRKEANCVMRPVQVNGETRLCLFATKDINVLEELRYDYGLNDLPWREGTQTAGSTNRSKSMEQTGPATTRRDKKDPNEMVTVSDQVDLEKPNMTDQVEMITGTNPAATVLEIDSVDTVTGRETLDMTTTEPVITLELASDQVTSLLEGTQITGSTTRSKSMEQTGPATTRRNKKDPNEMVTVSDQVDLDKPNMTDQVEMITGTNPAATVLETDSVDTVTGRETLDMTTTEPVITLELASDQVTSLLEGTQTTGSTTQFKSMEQTGPATTRRDKKDPNEMVTVSDQVDLDKPNMTDQVEMITGTNPAATVLETDSVDSVTGRETLDMTTTEPVITLELASDQVTSLLEGTQTTGSTSRSRSMEQTGPATTRRDKKDPNEMVTVSDQVDLDKPNMTDQVEMITGTNPAATVLETDSVDTVTGRETLDMTTTEPVITLELTSDQVTSLLEGTLTTGSTTQFKSMEQTGPATTRRDKKDPNEMVTVSDRVDLDKPNMTDQVEMITGTNPAATVLEIGSVDTVTGIETLDMTTTEPVITLELASDQVTSLLEGTQTTGSTTRSKSMEQTGPATMRRDKKDPNEMVTVSDQVDLDKPNMTDQVEMITGTNPAATVLEIDSVDTVTGIETLDMTTTEPVITLELASDQVTSLLEGTQTTGSTTRSKSMEQTGPATTRRDKKDPNEMVTVSDQVDLDKPIMTDQVEMITGTNPAATVLETDSVDTVTGIETLDMTTTEPVITLELESDQVTSLLEGTQTTGSTTRSKSMEQTGPATTRRDKKDPNEMVTVSDQVDLDKPNMTDQVEMTTGTNPAATVLEIDSVDTVTGIETLDMTTTEPVITLELASDQVTSLLEGTQTTGSTTRSKSMEQTGPATTRRDKKDPNEMVTVSDQVDLDKPNMTDQVEMITGTNPAATVLEIDSVDTVTGIETLDMTTTEPVITLELASDQVTSLLQGHMIEADKLTCQLTVPSIASLVQYSSSEPESDVDSEEDAQFDEQTSPSTTPGADSYDAIRFRSKCRDQDACDAPETDSCDSSERERDPDYLCPDSEEGSDSDSSAVIPIFQLRQRSNCHQIQEGDCTVAEADTPSCSNAATEPRSPSRTGSNAAMSSSVEHTSRYKPPKRMCPFCGISQAKLSRHIRLKHGGEEEVSKAMNAPQEERLMVFDKLKKRGILKANKEEATKERPQYQKERKSTTGGGKIVMCENCNGFFNRRFVKRHAKLCCRESGPAHAAFVPISLLSQLDEDNDGFVKNILGKLREDEIGLMCRNDPAIILIGKRLWQQSRLKVDKQTEVRKNVMTSMRRLASLYMLFLKQEDELGSLQHVDNSAADMFLRGNFSHLESGVRAYTVKGDGASTDDLKHGLKSGLYYLIKKAGNILKGTYLITDQDEKASGLDKFMHVFEMNHNFLFGDATYAMYKSRNESLRKPESLPREDDVATVREYTLSRMEAIAKTPFLMFDSHAYIELRDLLVCRLTLFNARRGGEPCRLRLGEWEDADNDAWINQQDLEKLDDLGRAMVKKMKIAYQTGKGNKHLVPCLLPQDTIQPLRIIANEENRSLAGVDKKNTYLFPSTQYSMNHVSGWHAVNSVCQKLSLQEGELLTATKNRHRVSTMYAALDVPEAERRYFYAHMGHSKETNEDIYQAPLALMEVVKVGRNLNQIDGGGDRSSGRMEGPSDTTADTTIASDSDTQPIERGGDRSSGRRMEGPSDTTADTTIASDSDTQPIERGGDRYSGRREGLSDADTAIASDSDTQPIEQTQKSSDQSDVLNEEGDLEVSQPLHSQAGANGSRSRANKRSSFAEGKKAKNGPKKKQKKYIQWKPAEENDVKTFFRSYIRGTADRKLPGKPEIEAYLELSETVNYDWLTVKTKVFNEKVKRRKLIEKRNSEMGMDD